MRCGAVWTDVCIKNMSVRGLMAETESPPPRGTYIEIRRGRQVIIGRIVWSRESQFGVRCQDRIDVDAIVSEPRLTSRPATADGAHVDRRAATRRQPTSEERAERSRRIAAAMQFVVLAGVGMAAAALIGREVYRLLSSPLAAAGAALVR